MSLGRYLGVLTRVPNRHFLSAFATEQRKQLR
jgi:hypothetical protein